MADIDSLLGIVLTQGADELRLATDEAPRMFARGAPKRLSIPVTSAMTLRHLLGPILSAREEQLRVQGKLELGYVPDGDKGGGGFRVTLRLRADAANPEKEPVLEAVFVRGAAPPSGPGSGSGARVPGLDGGASLVGGGQSSATDRSSTPAVAHAAQGAAPRVTAPSAASVTSAPGPGSSPATAATTVPDASARGAQRAIGSAASLAQVLSDESDGGARVPGISTSSFRESAPGPELSSILARARELRASDLHLLDGSVPSVRIDGALSLLEGTAEHSVSAILRELASGDAGRELLAGRSADRVLELEGGRFRINVYRAAQGLAAAIRVLPRSAPSLPDLHLPMALDDLVTLPHGLVIVCGPTGSGKSPTLAALAQSAVRHRAALLLSLEDPIEYLIVPGEGAGLVRQRQIGRDVRDFQTGLRDALREDPDVILVGEMRDAESIGLALTAAETGHLVLTSLHSRSAPSAIDRIVDASPASRHEQVRAQLADSLRAVVAQRLLRRARGNGRVPALEVMRGTHNVANLIREGKIEQLPTAIQSGRKDGMISLEACLADLVRTGQIRREDATEAANHPAELAGYLEGRAR